MSGLCDHDPCTPECEADIYGHFVFDGHVVNLLPGLCHCDCDLGGVPGHFTDPDLNFHRAIGIIKHDE